MRALAFASFLFAGMMSMAQAATFNLLYELEDGDLVGAVIDGDLQMDGNTVVVSSISDATFNGSPGPALPFVDRFTGFLLASPGPAFLSLDGSVGDAIFCVTGACDVGFSFETSGVLGVPIFISSAEFGNVSEVYVPARFSLTPVGAMAPIPLPASALFLVSGVAGLGALSRRRKRMA